VKDKPTPPYQLWNEAVDFTGCGRKASAQDGAHALKKLRGELGSKFDAAFRLRMTTARAETLEQLLEDWAQERTRLGV
jgi:hypothetical protein